MKNINNWDKMSDKKFTIPFDIDRFSEIVSKDKTIIDVGCGYGRILKILYSNGYNDLIGVDTSLSMLKQAKIDIPTAKYFDSINSVKDNSADAVILFGTLVAIYDDEEQVKFISEIKRVLKQNGIIYISDFLINDDIKNKIKYKKYNSKYKNYGTFETKEGVVMRHNSKERIKELFNVFNNVNYEETNFSTINNNTSKGFYIFANN